MRLVTFRSDGGPRVGARDGEILIDLSRADPALPARLMDILGLADGLARAAKAAADAPAAARIGLQDVELLPPIPEPRTILCLGLNYADHAAEAAMEKPAAPNIFMRAATSLAAHGAPIVKPKCSDQLDFEGELVAVVGRRCHNVPKDRALEVIAGYSVFNDGSIRDFQMRASQWTLGKNFDSTGGFGPDLVTADALPPGAAGLKLETRLNGQVMQSADTADMVYDVAETVAYVTQGVTLRPGDLLVMGTPAGVGMARRPPVWMQPGDVVEVEIESVGRLSNPIVEA